MAIAEAARQRRATVAFRLILIIPHLFVLIFLMIAACVVVFLGWWGALFTGRLPEFAVTYLSGCIRWYVQVLTYMYLLTDVYPPFTLDDVPAYPVRVEVPPQQRLNRFAVFFRAILSIPAGIVAAVALNGTTSIVIFIAWLITLINGKLPHSLHQALTAVLRYQTRFNCYYWMLTPTYPWGLFGDKADALDASDVPSGYPEPGAWHGAPQPGGVPHGVPGYGTPESVYSAQGGYGIPAGYGAPQPVFQPASWQLRLTSAARQLVVLFIVLGTISYVFNGVRSAITMENAIHRAQHNNAIDELNSSYSRLNSNLDQWQSTVTACDKNLTCVTKADGMAAAYFSSFANELRAIPMPSGADAAANRLYSDATRTARDFTELSQATTVPQYQNTFTSSGLQQTLDGFDQDYNALGTALTNS